MLIRLNSIKRQFAWSLLIAGCFVAVFVLFAMIYHQGVEQLAVQNQFTLKDGSVSVDKLSKEAIGSLSQLGQMALDSSQATQLSVQNVRLIAEQALNLAGNTGPPGPAGQPGLRGLTGLPGASGLNGLSVAVAANSPLVAIAGLTGVTLDCPTCITSSDQAGLVSLDGDILINGQLNNRLLGAGDVGWGLSSTGVTAGSYGSGSTVPVFTVDSKGRLSAVSNTLITGLTSANMAVTAGITNQQLSNSAIALTAGVGLAGGGNLQLGSGGAISINAPACSANQRLSWNGSDFSCPTVAAGTITNANTFYAGPASGSASTPGYRSIVAADLGSGLASVQTVLMGNLGWAQLFDGGGKIDTDLLPASILGALKYAGTWDASANSPTLASGGVGGIKGDYYIVGVAGNANVDGESAWALGDWIVHNGTTWDKVVNSNSVSSVNGLQGAVVLATDNVSEGSINKYFSNALARGAINSVGPIVYSSATGTVECPTCVTTINNGSILVDGNLSASGSTSNRLIGSSDVEFSLNNTGVSVGSYGTTTAAATFSVDEHGRLTSAGTTAFDASIIQSGHVSAGRGGTGLDGGVAANGQLLIGNGSGYSLSTISQSGPIVVSNGSGSVGISCPTCVVNNGNGNINASSDLVVSGTKTNRLIGTGDVNFDLSASGVVPASYGATNQVGTFTVDSKGRITGAANVGIGGLNSGNLAVNAAITNAQLQNSAIGLTTGNGLSGGGTLSLGGNGSIDINSPTCAANERLSWSGSAFTCNTVAADTLSPGNRVYASPGNGSTGTPIFRSLVAADLATGTANSRTVLVGNQAWLELLDTNNKIKEQFLPASGALVYKGTWNATTNSPTLGNGGAGGVAGDFYIVSVAGTTNIDGELHWEIGDWIINNGTIWTEVENTNQVTSVNSLTGAVVLNTSNIAENGSLYFTDSRSRAALSAIGPISYNNSNGVIDCPSCVTTTGNGDVVAGTGITVAGTSTGRLIGAGNLTFGLASSVATSVNNDSNITGTISANVLSLGFAGQLSAARGGTGLNGGSASNGQLLIGNGSGYSLATINGTANQLSVVNGPGSITLSLPQGISTISSPIFAGQTLGAAAVTNGQLTLKNSSNSNSTVLQSGAAAANITFTLPTTTGSAGQVLSTNGSGVLSWIASGSCATCFVNGGNSTGGLAIIGTNDNNPLAFNVNNLEVMRLLGGGNLVLGTTSAATGAGNSFSLANSSPPTGSPLGAGLIFSEAGVIKTKSSSGDITALEPDPIGEMTMAANATITNVLTAGTMLKVAGTTILSAGARSFDMPVANRLRYTAPKSKLGHIEVTISYKTTGGSNQNIRFQIYKNGSPVTAPASKDTLKSTTDYNSLTLQATTSLAQNDYLELWATNDSSATNDIVVETLSASVITLSAGTD